MATDISVTLGLNDTNYTSKLKAAENTAKSFSQSSTSAFSSVQNGLNATGNAVEGLNKKFQTLTTVLVGVGIADFAASLFGAANQLKDIADGLDTSISRMLEMGKAASEAGGSLDKVSAMMSKLQINAGDAANGNSKLRLSFQEVGLSMSDLQNLTIDQTFNKVSEALAGIENPADRARIANELFGKSFRGFSFEQYSKNIKETYGTMEKFGESQEKAAALNEKLNSSMLLLKTAFLDLLTPLMDFIPASGDMATQMKQAETAALALGAAFATFGLAATINALGSIGTALKGLTGFFIADTVAVAANTVALTSNSEMFKFRASAMAVLGTATKNTIAAELALNAALATGNATKAQIVVLENAVAAAREKVAFTTAVATKTTQAYAVVQAEVGVASGLAATGTTAAAGGIAASGVAATAATGPMYAFGVALGKLVALLGKVGLVVVAIEGISFALEKAFGTNPIDYFADKLESLIADKFPRLHQAVESIGAALGMAPGKIASKAETTEAPVTKAADDAAAKRAAEIAAADAKAAASAKLVSDKIKDVTIQYTAQAEAIKKTTEQMNWTNQRSLDRISLQTKIIGLSKAEQDAQLAAFDATTKHHDQIIKIDEAIAAMQAKRRDAPKIFDLEGGDKVIAAYEAQKKLLTDITQQAYELTKAETQRKESAEMTTYFLDVQKKAADAMLDAEHELADLTATENEKKLSSVQRQIDAEVRLAIAKRQAQLGEGVKINDAEAKAIEGRVRKSYEGIVDATARTISKSREFSTGWSKAMKQYVEDSTNAAKQAESLFTKAFSGMEDAIVNFAKTGKFEWKGFVASMLEELLRSQIKNLFANMMTSMSGSLGGLASAFGVAGAAPAGLGQQSQSGGLMDSISSIFGGGSSGKGAPVYVTNLDQLGVGGGISGLLGGGSSTRGSSGGGVLESIASIFTTPSAPVQQSQMPQEDDWLGSLFKTVGASNQNQSFPSVPILASGGGIGGGDWGGGIFSGIADTFSGIGESIGSLFDGWFADGGTIGAGKFGVVGERGPELVRGPGTVSPFSSGGSGSGSTTNVYYTINATDAQSFKAMIAADPSFIYAVSLQGSKGMRA